METRQKKRGATRAVSDVVSDGSVGGGENGVDDFPARPSVDSADFDRLPATPTDTDVSTNSEMPEIVEEISLNRRTRIMEKKTLTNLNNRLAAYIDQVRQLELENQKLTLHIKEVEVSEKRERNSVVGCLEKKVKELRNVLDDAIKEKTQMSIEAKAATGERDELKDKVENMANELKQAEKVRRCAEELELKLQAEKAAASNVRRLLEADIQKLLAENGDLKEEMKVLQKQLDEETVESTSLLHQIQALKEDCDFLKKTHETQLEEIRLKRQTELTMTTREMERTYESRLQEQMQAMRAEFDARLAKNRREIDETYKCKLVEAGRAWQQANAAREEAVRFGVRVQELEKLSDGYVQQISHLQSKVDDLEKELRRAREDHEVRLQLRDERLLKLQQENDRLLTEYQDLFELKVQLDTELQAYQSLLEGEENRLNISRSSGSASGYDGQGQLSARRATKRKRISDCSDITKMFHSVAHSDSDVEICASDVDGRFIKLANVGKEAVPVGEWSIWCVAGGVETVYKFHSRQFIDPGGTITVYSAQSGEVHNPPTQLVMKTQSWPTGDVMKVKLLDAEGNEMATRESVAQGCLDALEEHSPESCTLM